METIDSKATLSEEEKTVLSKFAQFRTDKEYKGIFESYGCDSFCTSGACEASCRNSAPTYFSIDKMMEAHYNANR